MVVPAEHDIDSMSVEETPPPLIDREVSVITR
jgi:hypothetical protein